MKKEKIIYQCDSCSDEIREGFLIRGCIHAIGKEIGKEIVDACDEAHYCRSCFKAMVGFKERTSPTAKTTENAHE